MIAYCTLENFCRGKNWPIWQIMSHSPKFSSPIFTDTWKTYIAYALTVDYSLNFFLAKYFPCTVLYSGREVHIKSGTEQYGMESIEAHTR